MTGSEEGESQLKAQCERSGGWRKVRHRKEEEEEEEVGKYMLAFISVIKKQGSRK